jgi:hypothetical protein
MRHSTRSNIGKSIEQPSAALGLLAATSGLSLRKDNRLFAFVLPTLELWLSPAVPDWQPLCLSLLATAKPTQTDGPAYRLPNFNDFPAYGLVPLE